jgi:predicted metal-dependent phosphoesterase TrpH
MSKFIDAHIHTNISDGTLSISEVVEIAKRNTSVFAITDHDTIIHPNSIRPLLESRDSPIAIPGVEISAYIPHRVHGKILVHLLGYGFNQSIKLDGILCQLKENRTEANKAFLASFLDKYKLIPNTTFSRLDISKYGRFSEYLSETILESQIGLALKQGASKYLKYNEPKLINYDVKINEAIDAIHSANGLAVLAHPIKYKKKYSLSNSDIKQIIKSLTDMGLDGLEVYHSDNYTEFSNRMLKLAEGFKLLVSSGSDCHGSAKGPEVIGYGKDNNLCLKETSLTNKLLQERLYFNQGGLR